MLHCGKQEQLEELKQKWYYIKQGSATAFSTRKVKSQTKINPYRAAFKQGATIVPRAFYFVELTQETPPDFIDRIINIKTSNAIQTDAKVPWKGLDFTGRIESKFLFRTALSKSILPFALYKPDLVALPITVKMNDQNEKEIHLHSADELMSDGYLNSSRFFKHAENTWNLLRTEKSKNMSANMRLDFQRGLTEQNLNAPYLVLYNSSAKDANAVMVNRKNHDLEFIIESVTYVFYAFNIIEAFYLAAIFNSTVPNEMMKDFQARGLFGARHVHKKILDIYFPKFNEQDEQHLKLAELSETAHKKAAKYLQDNSPKEELIATRLGRLRVEIKKHLSSEMKEIDKIVKKLIAN